MSLAASIRELYSAGRKVSEIARELNCTTAYVRVVARQRSAGGVSESDRRYTRSIKGHAARKAALAALLARRRALKETADMVQVKQAQRRAYRLAREQGLTKRQASGKAWTERARSIRLTGDKDYAATMAALARTATRAKIIRQKDTTDVGTASDA